MGVFKRTGRVNPDGLDWSILQNGWMSRYWRSAILNDDLKWFENKSYVLIEFDCRTWHNDHIMHSQLKTKFDFPDYYGENFNALRDCLRDLNIIKSGLVVVFRHLDQIKAPTAHKILDIMADCSRQHMLFGSRIITLIQVDNPNYEIGPVGRSEVTWNSQEWANSRRITEDN